MRHDHDGKRMTWCFFAALALLGSARAGEPASNQTSDTKALLCDYVRRFNATDNEDVTNAIPNAAAESFLLANVPRFACPDADIERTYYFRWWTYRKHLRRKTGYWAVSEFLPNVHWAGRDNTIVCPAGHHFMEGRWLRDPQYMTELARFWLFYPGEADPCGHNCHSYANWILTGIARFAEVAGLERELSGELLPNAVTYYWAWVVQSQRWAWPQPGCQPMGGDGEGGFLSIDNFEGTECSLGRNGWKPMMNSAMVSEARVIAEAAELAGDPALAEIFRRKAERTREVLNARCWNGRLGFYVTCETNGVQRLVRELHGYAPWYFGVADANHRPDWSQLADTNGFAAACGLTFPERRGEGFSLSYEGHACKWNGPSWPFATSVALTAMANDLHSPSAPREPAERDRLTRLYASLVRQYAVQQQLTRPKGAGVETVPWIDESAHPDRPEWFTRAILQSDGSKVERGKDYNHSTFCDLVISGLVGFVPKGKAGFVVEPLIPPDWDWFVLEDLRYRGHDIAIRWQRGASGLTVWVDGRVAAQSEGLRAEVQWK